MDNKYVKFICNIIDEYILCENKLISVINHSNIYKNNFLKEYNKNIDTYELYIKNFKKKV
jgi:hypothetical protein